MKKDFLLRRNVISSLMVQVAALLFSFIVPKCILQAYGSVANGTVVSITGFLGFITLMEAGVANVSRAALFRPVSEKQREEITYVVNETHAYFQKVVALYMLMVLLFMAFSSKTLHNGESFFYNCTLVGAIAITNIVQYYFGAGYQQVLWAEQKVYLLNLIQTLAYVLNIAGVYFMIYYGASIQIVKLVSSGFFILKPIFCHIYVKRKYQIRSGAFAKEPVLKQKWNNLLQTVAYYVHSKTDVVVLTVFMNMETVSIYGVYVMITTGLSSVIGSMCNGYTAKVGNLYGKKDVKSLCRAFEQYEHFVCCISFGAFTIAHLTILDFVALYTKQMHDAQYCQPAFALVILLAEGIYCLRIPYANMVSVAGHFKETQASALWEAVLNILISLFAVARFGLVGISIGTLIAMGYRGLYLVFYLSKHILFRQVSRLMKRLLIFTFVPFGSVGFMELFFSALTVKTYMDWILKAGISTIVVAFFIGISYVADARLNPYQKEEV